MQRSTVVLLTALTAAVAVGSPGGSGAATPPDGTSTVAHQRTSAFQRLDELLVKAEYEAANPGAVGCPGQPAAFSVLHSAPVLALYLLVQRLAGGSFAMAGAVKG